MEYKEKHCIVIGLGDTGLSAAKWLTSQGARVTVADSRNSPPNLDEIRAVQPAPELRIGAFDDKTFADADVLVVSPGVALATPQIASAIEQGIPAVGDVEILAQQLVGKASKVIAITGANGKSTVTSMVGAMCAAAGLKTEVAGNIGLPVLEALSNWQSKGELPDVWVLELSSFQLETTQTLHPAAAAVLNVTEDHLDRYEGSMQHYAAAKARIFAGHGVQVLNRADSWCQSMALPEREIVWFGTDSPRNAGEYGLRAQGEDFALCCGEETLMLASQLPLAGLHNASNALAAIALCRAIGLELPPLVGALKSFQGLAHRVEFVAEVNGVRYYDDSKGTNVGATEAALKGMTRPVVLIAGGDGKGQDFAPLKAACERICRAVLLIGRDGPQIAEVLNEAHAPFLAKNDDEECFLPVLQLPTLEMAVEMAAQFAEPGDVVLLSPACASWDMFRNYGHRADVFIQSVKALPA